MWQCLPIEIFWPFGQIKSKLEAHVCWQSNEIIEIVRSEDSSNVCVGTNVDRSDLVASIDQIAGWKDFRSFEELINIKNYYCPAIVLELKRNLSNKTVGSVEVLEQVTDRYSNSMGSLRHTKVKMVTKRKPMLWRLDLQVQVSSSKTKRLDGTLRRRHLYEVIGQYRSLNLYRSPAYFFRLYS